LQHDLGTGGLRPRIQRVRVRNDDVRSLRLSIADLVRLFHQSIELGFFDRAAHDHAIAEAELSVGNGPAFTGDDDMLPKPEGSAEPLDCGLRMAIAKTGYPRRSSVFRRLDMRFS